MPYYLSDSLILLIRLNTITLIILTISGTHNFAKGSLILLHNPLHLFILMEYYSLTYILKNLLLWAKALIPQMLTH